MCVPFIFPLHARCREPWLVLLNTHPFFLPRCFFLPHSPRCFFSLSLCSVRPIISALAFFFLLSLLFHFSALALPYCMDFSCSYACLRLFPCVSLALPSFLGNQLILCVSKPLCLRSSSLCFRFIQQGD